ncbi:MAG: hypothetical protein B7Y84_11350 [Azorhizobium sp. 32-67-21]|nr:MAG: hypothetical protein B7Y84_11350 [Azorhizobium sp. 32-67-21]
MPAHLRRTGQLGRQLAHHRPRPVHLRLLCEVVIRPTRASAGMVRKRVGSRKPIPEQTVSVADWRPAPYPVELQG